MNSRSKRSRALRRAQQDGDVTTAIRVPGLCGEPETRRGGRMDNQERQLRSQDLRTHNHQGDALRLGMNWTEEELAKPQVLVESAWGMGHPGTFHFGPLVDEVSHGIFETGGKPGVFTVSDICDGVVQATPGMSYSLV